MIATTPVLFLYGSVVRLFSILYHRMQKKYSPKRVFYQMFSFQEKNKDDFGIVVHSNSKLTETILFLYQILQKNCGKPQFFLDSIYHI